MSAVYANFFNPQTLSILFCLSQLQKMAENREVDMHSDLVKFLLDKILTITDENRTAKTNLQFMSQMFSVTNNEPFLAKYQQAIGSIDNFNKFYGDVSVILKNLRSMRNSKLEQSNLVDFFVRRLYIYFQKLDFKEIVKIYQAFRDYLNEIQRPIKQHEFMLTKSIEQVKFNMQNYSFEANPEHLQMLIQNIAADDHTFKTSYLKGMMYAQQGAPVQSSHYLRRYFDKNLSNLFQDRMAQGVSSNKINHCILSGAYAGLQLQHLDQCLQSISQGLRISQNNADEESINNCIIYLYHVAQRLGKFREQILLAEHAITHSLNQNNLTLTLYSCLSCSLFQQKYDTSDLSLSLLKTRQVSWKDALHFAKKRLHSHYQNNCRNIFHLFRNLMIPSFIHKLAILAQIPQLRNLLINPYYNRKQLLDLKVYKQFMGENTLNQKIKQTNNYSKMCFSVMLNESLQFLTEQQNILAPFQKVKIKALKNQIAFRQGSLTACYQSTQELLAYCTSQGFAKQQYINALLMVAEILSINQLLYDALIKVQQALRLATQHAILPLKNYSLIVKAGLMIRTGHLGTPIQILKDIQEKGILNSLENKHLRKFHQTKLLLNERVFHIVSEIQKQTIHKNILHCYQNIIKLSIEQQQLQLCIKWIQKMLMFVGRHPVFNVKGPSLQQALKFCVKARDLFRSVQHRSADDEGIMKKCMQKVRRMVVQQK